MMYELPITNDPSQEFVCELDEKKYLFRLQLNVRGEVWTLDINTFDDVPIVTGLAMVIGSDLLESNRFIKGELFVVDYTGRGIDPSAENLTDYGLIWDDGEDYE